MADAVSVKDLKAKQDVLRKRFEGAQSKLQDAQKEHYEAKAKLVEFNNKYGRVLRLMEED